MKERIYDGIIVALLCLFAVFFIVSHHNYIGVVERNNDLLNLLEVQKAKHKSVVGLWEENYFRLEDDYTRLNIENNKLKETSLPVYKYTEDEVYLLAQCVEAEAGDYDNHKTSQKYITQVILNRLHSSEFPNSIEEVIYQKRGNIPQFSVAYNGMMDREVEPETLANVYSVLVHGTDLPEYVCYFYSDSVVENWVNTLPVYDTIDGTVFAYEDKEEY